MAAELSTDSRYDVVVAGGGLGGVAAALRAAAMGARVLLIEETGLLGGQATAQGVSVLDEHRLVEKHGAALNYLDWRERIRDHYRVNYHLSKRGHSAARFNPGSSEERLSRLAFEPLVGARILWEMTEPAQRDGLLDVLLETDVNAVRREGDRITALSVYSRRQNLRMELTAACVVDATELGDLLTLAGVGYRTGVEAYAETGEPSAPEEGVPGGSQAITFVFAVEWRPGETHVIEKPVLYDELRSTHPFTFNGFKMFEHGTFSQSFWEYRRILDARNFTDERVANDVIIVNWLSTDYHEETIIDHPPEVVREHLARARQLALSFLFWLQTEALRDNGGQGYPELMLRPDVMGTSDGLAAYPYVRESRRLKALHTIREQDIVAGLNPGARARLLPDSVGLGHYYQIDLHRCCHTKLRLGSGGVLTPFQIPLGALLTGEAANLIAGCKNIGTTHITNGAYRYHPVEWNIGEAAGATAALAARLGVEPVDVYRQKTLLNRLQLELLRSGSPLFWFRDLPPTHGAFLAGNFLAVSGIIGASSNHLDFEPDTVATSATTLEWVDRARLRYRIRRKIVTELLADLRGRTHGECAVRLLRVLWRPLGLPGRPKD